jgi:hypothetical protein
MPASTGARCGASSGAGPDTALVGIVAKLSHYKSHDVFLGSCGAGAAAAPATRFAIVGPDPDGARSELEALAATIGGQHGVPLAAALVFTGPRQDVPQILAALDVSVSASATPWEGLSGVMRESLAMARPVVCTDVGRQSRSGARRRHRPPGAARRRRGAGGGDLGSLGRSRQRPGARRQRPAFGGAALLELGARPYDGSAVPPALGGSARGSLKLRELRFARFETSAWRRHGNDAVRGVATFEARMRSPNWSPAHLRLAAVFLGLVLLPSFLLGYFSLRAVETERRARQGRIFENYTRYSEFAARAVHQELAEVESAWLDLAPPRIGWEERMPAIAAGLDSAALTDRYVRAAWILGADGAILHPGAGIPSYSIPNPDEARVFRDLVARGEAAEFDRGDVDEVIATYNEILRRVRNPASARHRFRRAGTRSAAHEPVG